GAQRLSVSHYQTAQAATALLRLHDPNAETSVRTRLNRPGRLCSELPIFILGANERSTKTLLKAALAPRWLSQPVVSVADSAQKEMRVYQRLCQSPSAMKFPDPAQTLVTVTGASGFIALH